MSPRAFLLEIGTEELPGDPLMSAMIQLELLMKNRCTTHRLSFSSVKAYGTPRRLVCLVEELADKQTSLTVDIRGPAKRVAYDAVSYTHLTLTTTPYV